MTEIAQLFESALRQNRANLLRKAAMNTVAKMPLSTTLGALLQSDAGEAVRELSLRDLGQALAGMPSPKGRRKVAAATSEDAAAVWPESREEKLYKQILEAIASKPQTIGQLSKRLDIETEELRGYLSWMKKMGKISSSGRARATRYQALR